MSKYWLILKERWQASSDKKLFFNWVILRLKKIFRFDFLDHPTNSDLEPIDIVIPTVSKDHSLLEKVLASLKNIKQPINKIYIVSQPDEFIKAFCLQHQCVFVDERSVLGYGKEAITYQFSNLDRRGWIFQQLLKLSGNKFVERENYFIVDSDTILIRPHSLLEKGKFVLFENEEWNEPYFTAFKKMFGYPVQSRLSFTSHMMIFNTNRLKEMKDELENRNGQSWDQVYLSTIDQTEQSCVSDYDTYAGWLWIHYPETITRKPLYNCTRHRDELNSLEELTKKYDKKYRSISFHSYHLKK